MTDDLRLTRTLAAVKEYDRIDAAFKAAPDDADYETLLKEIDVADLAVREAFALDTADRNSRQNAMLVGAKNRNLRKWLFNEEGYALPGQCHKCGNIHATPAVNCWHCGSRMPAEARS